ncbi:putative peptidoglycan bound protein [Listeria monocytogenes]|nr:putative peptidoglycan bound protein [Listeria monocytogenes]
MPFFIAFLMVKRSSSPDELTVISFPSLYSSLMLYPSGASVSTNLYFPDCIPSSRISPSELVFISCPDFSPSSV